MKLSLSENFTIEAKYYSQKVMYSILAFIAATVSLIAIICGGAIYGSYNFCKRKAKPSDENQTKL